MNYLIGCNSKNNFPADSISSNYKVKLSWDEVPGAASYNVYLSTRPNVNKLNSSRIQNAANPLTIVDLEPGATYYFTVTVVDDFGEGGKSKEISYHVIDPEGFVKIENLLAPRDQIIFFNTNSTKLSKSEKEKLDRFSQYIIEFDDYQIDLNGYTDSAGDVENNRLMSKYRAEAVKSFLVGKGIKSKSIDVFGYGASNFISDNDTAEGRGMNRRVEIKFFILQ
jgi:outer membrane protein OmpA-like peptidoglycan-associated protein